MKKLYRVLSISVLLLAHQGLRAEGTREVMPNNVNGTGLIVSTIGAFPLGKVGAYLGCPTDKRIYFNIKDFTKENLYYAFRWNFLTISGATTPYTDVYMRIFDPSNTLVIQLNLPTAGPGFITSYAEAVNGPNIGGATPAGYSPLTFTPTQNGDYSVEFFRSSDGGLTQIAGGESMISPWFDMTVGEADNTQHLGRVYCNLWAFSVYDPATFLQSPSLSSDAPFFAYTKDSVIAKIDFEVGFRPLSFVLAFNDYGFQNTGNWVNDRRSVNATSLPALANSYKVFLNRPDSTLYPVSPMPLAPTLVNPIISGCPPGPYFIRFNAPQPGDYYILLDLNGVPGYQASSADRFFELVNQPAGIISCPWDGLDGLGVPVPNNTALPITFSFRKGRVNVPLYDVELNVNGFNVSGIAPMSQPKLPLYWNDTLLSTIGGGACSSGTTTNNNTGVGYRNDIVGQVSPGHAWNGDGNPGFTIPAPAVAGNDVDAIQCNDFGNARLINTWAWGIELYASQTLTLACVNVSGTVWDDADNSAVGTFSNIRTNSEPGTNAAGNLYAILVDPLTSNVLASAPVNPDGTYSIYGSPIDAVGVKVILSSTNGVFGNPAPAPNLPSGWIRTSPLFATFNTSITDMTGYDFGIEKQPESDPQSYIIADPALNSYLTLNGSGGPSSPGPLTGLDFEDGSMGTGKRVVITQVPTNAEMYYNGVLLSDNAVIPSYNPNLLRLKFTVVGTLSTSFQYAWVDAASEQDATPAVYMLQWAWILPTKLTSFTASRNAQSVTLNWSTASETKGITFVVERSNDGRTFYPIGRVASTGVVSSAKYNFTDNTPLINATTYYRLQLADPGGARMYSNTVPVAYTFTPVVEVAPNPFTDQVSIKIKLTKPGNVFVRLMDAKGVVVQQYKYFGTRGDNRFEVKGLSILPRSSYYLQMAWEDRTMIQKISNQ